MTDIGQPTTWVEENQRYLVAELLPHGLYARCCFQAWRGETIRHLLCDAELSVESYGHVDRRIRRLDQRCLDTIARHKRPKEYVVVDELPRNAAGKVLKRELRELYMERVPDAAR